MSPLVIHFPSGAATSFFQLAVADLPKLVESAGWVLPISRRVSDLPKFPHLLNGGIVLLDPARDAVRRVIASQSATPHPTNSFRFNTPPQ